MPRTQQPKPIDFARTVAAGVRYDDEDATTIAVSYSHPGALPDVHVSGRGSEEFRLVLVNIAERHSLGRAGLAEIKALFDHSGQCEDRSAIRSALDEAAQGIARAKSLLDN
jgi:hypothetical protein